MKKVLLVTFSDNADHQDITFGMFESIAKSKTCEIWLLATKTPKVSLNNSDKVFLVKCPKKPGVELKTFDLLTITSTLKWIKKQMFDVIFFESLHVWNLPIMRLCHKNVKIFQMIHDLIPHDGDKQAKSVDLMNKAVCKLADFIVLANRKYVSMATDIYGINPSRVLTVDMWRRFPKYTAPLFTKRALFFGRMNPYKGIDNLLEIVKLCPNVQFDVVGRVDPLVREQVDKLNTFPNVNLNTGYVSDEEMAEAFKNADWIILPYNSATQSGVIIDGYRYGRPCIAFNVGAISEQVEDGKSGFLINTGDIDAFVKCLRSAVSMDKDSYYEMSKECYRYGLEKYSSDGAVFRFMDLINS